MRANLFLLWETTLPAGQGETISIPAASLEHSRAIARQYRFMLAVPKQGGVGRQRTLMHPEDPEAATADPFSAGLLILVGVVPMLRIRHGRGGVIAVYLWEFS
jgi:hypothetical protein